jgi:hypothetical protein
MNTTATASPDGDLMSRHQVAIMFRVTSARVAQWARMLQVGSRSLPVQLAEPFPLAELVELGRDDRGGPLVGGPGELGIKPQGGGAFGVP